MVFVSGSVDIDASIKYGENNMGLLKFLNTRVTFIYKTKKRTQDQYLKFIFFKND